MSTSSASSRAAVLFGNPARRAISVTPRPHSASVNTSRIAIARGTGRRARRAAAPTTLRPRGSATRSVPSEHTPVRTMSLIIAVESTPRILDVSAHLKSGGRRFDPAAGHQSSPG
jgi:hypothetical protein